jgi:hypothetical protein
MQSAPCAGEAPMSVDDFAITNDSSFVIQSVLIYAYGFGALALGYWSVRTQQQYFDRLDRRSGTKFSIEQEVNAAAANPLTAFLSSPRRTAVRMRALSEVQTDPELESLRQKCLRRRLIALTFFIGGGATFVVLRILGASF